MAQAEGKNVIWDVTMAWHSSTVRRINALHDAGYTELVGVFVDIPIEVSLMRADSRYREGHEEYRRGIGSGGRFVPEEMILAQADLVWGSKNRASFEQSKQLFQSWFRYDNSANGRPPVIVETNSAV
jgi:hypothetical protein